MEFQQCVVLYKPRFHTSYSICFYSKLAAFLDQKYEFKCRHVNVADRERGEKREVKPRRPRPVLGACCGARAQAGWIFLIYQEQKIRTPWKTESTSKWQRDLHVGESFEFCCSDLEYFPVRSGGVWPLARATITTFMNTMGTSPPAISHRSLSSLEITGWWWMRWDTPWWRAPSASPWRMSSTKQQNEKEVVVPLLSHKTEAL